MVIAMPKRERPVTESSVLREVQIAVARIPHVYVARNNVGKMQDVTGRWVTFGLGIGSADLVGYFDTGIVAAAFGLEVKKPGHRTSAKRVTEQRQWQRAMTARHMPVWQVESATEAETAVRLWISSLSTQRLVSR